MGFKLTYDLQHDLPVSRGRPLKVHPAPVRPRVVLGDPEQREHRGRRRLCVELRAAVGGGGRQGGAVGGGGGGRLLARRPDLTVGVVKVATKIETEGK
jgi:hypothetical protein